MLNSTDTHAGVLRTGGKQIIHFDIFISFPSSGKQIHVKIFKIVVCFEIRKKEALEI